MTLAEWQNREDLQLRWSETWAQPHMIEGLAVLTEMGLPQGTAVPGIDINALRNAFNEGYFKALSNARFLAHTKPLERKPLPPPWQKTKLDQGE